MQNLTLSWQTAGGASAVLLAASYAVRRAAAVRPDAHRPAADRPATGRAPAAAAVLREAGTLLALFALWQLAGHLSLMGADHALDRARRIHRAELALGLPDEASWQRAVLPYPWLVKAANYYYAVLHFGAMIALLLWVFLRHRRRYAWVRTTVVLVTAACLLVQFVPVAPPRMLPGSGFVDVAVQYGQSVYGGPVGGVVADELSAMPSVHVAWCVLVAVAVVRISRSRWRWLAVLHAAATVAVVVVTANHFWADGIVAVALLLLAYAVQAGAAALLRPRAAGAVPGAAPGPVAPAAEAAQQPVAGRG
ncbi:phosphatase PAP2 family protein [Streptomyces sp. NPDC001380]|uniref:phosphatase PAP2 family protein n=1 Tax=Streptomyces sp. NPDC001380 TaxID=3364566 RepID=UPI00369886AA